MNDNLSARELQDQSGRTLAPVATDRRQPEWGDSLGENAQESPSGSPLSVGLLWQSFRHWWFVTLPIGLVLAGAAAAFVWTTFERVYQAQALLKIESNRAFIFYSERGAGGGSDRFEQTQVELLRSSVVLDRVIERPEIAKLPEILAMDSPASTLGKELSVGALNSSDLFFVRFTSPNPEGVAAIVNAVVAQYVRLKDDVASKSNKRIIELVEAEVRKRDLELTQLRAELQLLESSLPSELVGQAADDSRSALAPQSPVAAWTTQLTNSIAEREVLIARLKAFEESIVDREVTVPSDVIDDLVEQSPEIVELRGLLATARLKLAEAESVAKNPKQDPAVNGYERSIQNYEARIEKLRSELRPAVESQAQKRYARTEQERLTSLGEAMKSDIKVSETFEGLLLERIEEQRQADRLPADGTEREVAEGDENAMDEQLAKLHYARADLDRAEQVYRSLLERADMLKTESRLPSRVSELQPAEVPSDPVERYPLRKMVTYGTAGLLFPFLLAFLWEFRVQRVVAGKQISSSSVLPLLAEVPKLPSRPILATAGAATRFDNRHGMLQDSVHYLCRNLLLSGRERDLQTLAVTSAVSGEGKTTLASQLATSLALYSGEKVLLIDADMRRPSAHDVFDIPISPGLVELLAGDGAADSVLEEILGNGQPNLISVLPAGKLRKHPHAVLGAGRFESLLDMLRQSFRYIVVDTPPVVAAGESLTLCAAVDGTLLCVMQDRSRQNEVSLAFDRLVATGANPMGVVLNGVSNRYYASRYSYYSHLAQQ